MSKIADLLDGDFSDTGFDVGGEVAALRVLRKREGRDAILRELFRRHGAALLRNVRLERSSRRTEFDEEQFVQFYPYLPHLMDLSIEILAGFSSGNCSIATHCVEMLTSDRTRIGEEPAGVLVSLDKIYELVEGGLAAEKQHTVFVTGQRCGDKRYPGMAARVAKAICLMEIAKTDLLRTTKNIAALLVERVTEVPPIAAVSAALERMKKAQLVSESEAGWTLYAFEFHQLRDAADALEGLKNAVGAVNPRPAGWHNDLIQVVKRLRVGALAWYTRPLRAYLAAVSRSTEEIVGVLDGVVDLPTDVAALQKRLARAEEQLALLQGQVAVLAGMPAKPSAPPTERTAYVVGLFGSGRQYVGELMRQNLGVRAKYFKDGIRLHSGPTPMIYSGHATLKYVSRAQHVPAVTRRVFEGVKAGIADLIFVYRHPLDSLLTNWVWWRSYLRERRCIAGISQVYRNADELCADLERNLVEFESFAEGDPAFFGTGPRFLSFAEFVEETELYLESAASLTLRMEDFAIDPHKEFSKIVRVMGVAGDSNGLPVAAPRSKPYGYLAVRDKVPRFRSFIDGLRAGTRKRIEKIGYDL
jgi:hypothetical protein